MTPTETELLALLTRIAEHGERLPPPLAIELQKTLAKYPAVKPEADDQPSTARMMGPD